MLFWVRYLYCLIFNFYLLNEECGRNYYIKFWLSYKYNSVNEGFGWYLDLVNVRIFC